MTSNVADRDRGSAHAPRVGFDPERVAHSLVPMAADLVERFGIAMCGYPAEYLTVTADVDWSDVPSGRRCPHCNDPLADRTRVANDAMPATARRGS